MDQLWSAGKRAVAVVDAVTVGSARRALDEAQTTPAQFCLSLVGTAAVGEIAGELLSFGNPWVTAFVGIAGGASSLVYAGDLVRRTSSDGTLLSSFDKAAAAPNWKTFTSALPDTEQSLGRYSWEVEKGLIFGSAGFKFGRVLGDRLIAGRSAGETLKWAESSLTAGAGTPKWEELSSTTAAGASQKAGRASAFVLFDKMFNYEEGQSRSLVLHDDGEASVTMATGSVESWRHKIVRGNTAIIYRPDQDAGRMLTTLQLLDPHSGDCRPMSFVQELLGSPSFNAVVEKLPGRWEPESSTPGSIEVRNELGQVINIKHKYPRPRSPFLIQGSGTQQIGEYELERLPSFTRPFKTPGDLPHSVISTMEQAGWHTTDLDPRNFGKLANNFVVALNPEWKHWIDAEQYPQWSEIDHSKALNIYSIATDKIKNIYGPDHPLFAHTRARMAAHSAELGLNATATQLYEDAFYLMQENEEYDQAAKCASNLFRIYRNMSNFGTNDALTQKALKYSNLAEQMTLKHYRNPKNW